MNFELNYFAWKMKCGNFMNVSKKGCVLRNIKITIAKLDTIVK